jgi:hypothetical protein
VATDRGGRPQLRYGAMIPVPGMAGDPEAMALYAGQSVGVVHEVAPAAQIVAEIASQAAQILAGFGRQAAVGMGPGEDEQAHDR